MRDAGRGARRLLLLMTALCLSAEALPEPVPDGGPVPEFAEVRRIVSARCRFCHTQVPQEDGLNAASQPPRGVKFDTSADYRLFAGMIGATAVDSRFMPPGNATRMTDAERATLGRWIAAGAPVPPS